ncbi:TetR/AcrR family transcriptional regulator [Isoptericola sediminis]|uniref:TetR/AcrR family transcriptional regulator n=1 Tax=Isoptericola sediminis TaxID=2733572 RepID=A0A849K1Q3_9MICO|nr:TetR/AcrR family transcriptional regulator [Isoptericola sediminis]NNU27108.1 TetR/AcrR family transcriptional regulator [Isoptericola sediminis]
MARASTARRAAIVRAARELLDGGGVDAVTMRAVADRLGIRAPSLYNHLPDKQALENALVSDGFAELAAALRQALEGSTDDEIGGIGGAYRAFARRSPHLYRLMTERELDRDELVPGVEAAAAQPLVDVLHGDEARARAVFAFMHGMATLELNRRFPAEADLDATWAVGLRHLAAETPPGVA